MVTVAKSFDAPIKLLFPRAFATATSKVSRSFPSFSLLSSQLPVDAHMPASLILSLIHI